MSEVSCREAGQRGGRTTANRYGTEHYRRIGSLGGQKTRQRWSHLTKRWGQLGGRPRKVKLEDAA